MTEKHANPYEVLGIVHSVEYVSRIFFNAAIDFSVEADEGLAFLRCWREGDWDTIKAEWPEFKGPFPPEASSEFLRLWREGSYEQIKSEWPEFHGPLPISVEAITHCPRCGAELYAAYATGDLSETPAIPAVNVSLPSKA